MSVPWNTKFMTWLFTLSSKVRTVLIINAQLFTLLAVRICLISIYQPVWNTALDFDCRRLRVLKISRRNRGLCHFSTHKINSSEKVFMRLQCDAEDMQPVLGRATTQQNCWATICSAGFTSLSNSLLLSSLYAAHYVSCRTIEHNQEQAGGRTAEGDLYNHRGVVLNVKGCCSFRCFGKTNGTDSKATCCCVHSDSTICFVQGRNAALHLNQLLWLMCKSVVSTTLAQRDT